MRKYKIWAVDFDGTLCENKFPGIGKMNKLLIEMLKTKQKEGDKIILWTCRVGHALTEAILACRAYGLFFDAINENLPEIIVEFGGDCRKIFADEYIDDKSSHGGFTLPYVYVSGKTYTKDDIEEYYKSLGLDLLPYQREMLKCIFSSKQYGTKCDLVVCDELALAPKKITDETLHNIESGSGLINRMTTEGPFNPPFTGGGAVYIPDYSDVMDAIDKGILPSPADSKREEDKK